MLLYLLFLVYLLGIYKYNLVTATLFICPAVSMRHKTRAAVSRKGFVFAGLIFCDVALTRLRPHLLALVKNPEQLLSFGLLLSEVGGM